MKKLPKLCRKYTVVVNRTTTTVCFLHDLGNRFYYFIGRSPVDGKRIL